MLPRKKRHLLYALLLLTLSVVCTTALAHSKVYTFIEDVASVIEENIPISNNKNEKEATRTATNSTRKSQVNTTFMASAPMTMLGGINAIKVGFT